MILLKLQTRLLLVVFLALHSLLLLAEGTPAAAKGVVHFSTQDFKKIVTMIQKAKYGNIIEDKQKILDAIKIL